MLWRVYSGDIVVVVAVVAAAWYCTALCTSAIRVVYSVHSLQSGINKQAAQTYFTRILKINFS